LAQANCLLQGRLGLLLPVRLLMLHERCQAQGCCLLAAAIVGCPQGY
jgi:hypothetical protein